MIAAAGVENSKVAEFKVASLSLSPQVSGGGGGGVGMVRSVQKCAECRKVFTNKSALAKHRLIHSNERKYACHLCDKSFKRQDHLNGHLLTHQDKKPFECKVPGCEKSYCDSRSLKRHVEGQHQDYLAQLAKGNKDALNYLPKIGKIQASIAPIRLPSAAAAVATQANTQQQRDNSNETGLNDDNDTDSSAMLQVMQTANGGGGMNHDHYTSTDEMVMMMNTHITSTTTTHSSDASSVNTHASTSQSRLLQHTAAINGSESAIAAQHRVRSFYTYVVSKSLSIYAIKQMYM